jgi:cysteine-S-conjugate beta-lyase
MKKLTPEARKKLRSRSRLVHLGRDSEASHGFVNIPTYRGSTVLFPDVATFRKLGQRYTYGTHGTPTTDALCEAWTELSGAAGTILLPSGLAAIGIALMSALSAGDHLLMTDAAYPPARDICDTLLKRMGVETTYYDPAVGSGISGLLRANTRNLRRGAGLGIPGDAGHTGDRGGGA